MAISNEELRSVFEEDFRASSTIPPDLEHFRNRYVSKQTEMRWRGFEAGYRSAEKTSHGTI